MKINYCGEFGKSVPLDLKPGDMVRVCTGTSDGVWMLASEALATAAEPLPKPDDRDWKLISVPIK